MHFQLKTSEYVTSTCTLRCINFCNRSFIEIHINDLASTFYGEINFLLRHINESLCRYLSVMHVPMIYEKIQFLEIDMSSDACTMKTQ